jgi:hypothetical protein
MAQQPPAPPPPPPPPSSPPPGGPVYGSGAVSGARPGGVTANSVLLFVVGGIRALLYLIAVVAIIGVSGELSDFGVSGGAVAVGVVLALIALAAGVLQIVGGAQLLRMRRQGRVIGLSGTIVGLALALFGVLGGGGGAVVIGVLLLLGDVAIIVLLAQNSRYLTNP